MPIEHELQGDGQVIYFKLRDPWTLEEMFKGFAATTALRDHSYQQDPTRRIHTLVDLMETTNPPPTVMQGRKIPGLMHPTGGEIVVAVKHEYPRSIVRAMLRVMHAEGHFYESLDAAWEYLRTIIAKTPVSGDAENKTT